jgi:hypothetical protein
MMTQLVCMVVVALVGGRLLYVRRAQLATGGRDSVSVSLGVALLVALVGLAAGGILPRANSVVEHTGLTTHAQGAERHAGGAQ